MGTYFFDVTLASGVVNPTASQLAYLQGVSMAPVLPFVRRSMARSLTNTLAPMNNFGRYESRGEGLGPNPRALTKGLPVTALEYELHGSTTVSQKGQIAMAMAMNGGLLNYLQSMGAGYAWTEHEKIVDLIANDAFSGTYQSFGVPFYSSSQPKYGTSATRSNRLASALDMTSYKAAIVQLDEMEGYDGEFFSQKPGGLMVPTDIGPDAVELVNSLTRTSVGTSSQDANGFGYSGPSFASSLNLSVITTPAMEDADAWILWSQQFAVDLLWLAPSRPKLEVLQGTEDVIISDNPIFQLLPYDHCAAIGGGPA